MSLVPCKDSLDGGLLLAQGNKRTNIKYTLCDEIGRESCSVGFLEDCGEKIVLGEHIAGQESPFYIIGSVGHWNWNLG